MAQDGHLRLAVVYSALKLLEISLVSVQVLASEESVMWLGPSVAEYYGQTISFTLHFYAFLAFSRCCKGTRVPTMLNFPILFPDKQAEELRR
jgi:hypothetical protein